MELYNLGKDIIAFTTDRTQGRDMQRICEALICNFPSIQGKIKNGLYPHQTHTDNVFHITEDFLALSDEERKNRLEGIDAVISNVPDVIMGISTEQNRKMGQVLMFFAAMIQMWGSLELFV